MSKIEDKLEDIEIIKKNLCEKSINNSKNILASLKFNDKTESISQLFPDGEAEILGSKDIELNPNLNNNFIDTYNKNMEDNVFNDNLNEVNTFENRNIIEILKANDNKD